MKLHYQPHKSRKREAVFIEALIDALPITEISTTCYPLSSSLAGRPLNINEILQSVDDLALSDKKKASLIQELEQLPSIVKVVLDSKQISCDVVIVSGGQPHYFEFHEEQHRRLTSQRPKKIFTMDDELSLIHI